MNASESYLMPKTRAKSNPTTMEESLLDDHHEEQGNGNLTFTDVSFNLENEMDISMIAKDSPKNENYKGEKKQEEEGESTKGNKENDKDTGIQQMKSKDSVSHSSYADMVQKKAKEAADNHPIGKKKEFNEKKYCFTAEELLEVEEEVLYIFFLDNGQFIQR